MKNKFFFIAYILIIVIVAVAGYLWNSATERVVPIAINNQDLSSPVLINATPMEAGNSSFVFSTVVDIPSILPGYTIESLQRDGFVEIARTGARNLGFASTPSGTINNKTFSLAWISGTEAEFTATQNDNDFSFLFRRVLAVTRPSPEIQQKSLVDQFMSSVLPRDAVYSLAEMTTLQQANTGLLILDSPRPKSFKEFAYTWSLDGFPLVDNTYALKATSVIVDDWNVIRFASIKVPPKIVSKTAGITLLNKNDILASLQNGRAGLLHTYDPRAPEWGVKPTFTSFTVEDLKTVYAPKDNALFPAFLLSGTGKSAGGSSQKSTLFMWAFSGN